MHTLILMIALMQAKAATPPPQNLCADGHYYGAVSVMHRVPLLLGVVGVSPGDYYKSDSAHRFYQWRSFAEPLIAIALAFLAVGLFVYGFAADGLRWYWRIASWLGCIISYIAGFFVTHDALSRGLWWFGL